MTTLLRYVHRYRPDINIITLVSKPHKLINDFLDSLDIEYKINDRVQVKSTELDIFIPKHNLAIEINGVYWHSVIKGKDENYHLNKLNKCIDKDIDLIHLTDIDILNKTDIVFNLIKEKLNLNKEIDSNKCSVIDLDKETCIQFIKENSLFEYKISNIHKGILYENEIVSVICLNKDIVTNYTTKLGYTIKNGLSKLTKDIDTKLIVHVDRNMYNKNTFEENNWVLKETTLPTLVNFNNNRMWNCGNKIYINTM